MDDAGDWLRAQADGSTVPTPGRGRRRASRASRRYAVDDVPGGAGPDPLDVPTDDQGRALAALDSGRWTVEPGTSALSSSGDGPGPSDALGLVRELRVRDWIDADGEVTLTGHAALQRWLDTADARLDRAGTARRARPRRAALLLRLSFGWLLPRCLSSA